MESLAARHPERSASRSSGGWPLGHLAPRGWRGEGSRDPSAPSGLQDDDSFVCELNNLPRLAVLAGPAGIGKTRLLLGNFVRLLRESKNPFLRDALYLLPSAEHRERIIDLILRKELAGFFGERVMTLSRLMQELLRTGSFSLVTDAERKFLLREIIPARAGAYFSGAVQFPGFLEAAGELIGEMKESMVSLEKFRKGVKKLSALRPELGEKYAGLLSIYEAYESSLEGLGMKDRRDGLFLLREAHASIKEGAPRFRHLLVDGFFDFSPSQLEFLGWLAERSERITLAMTAERSGERKELFEIPLKNLTALEKLGFKTVELSGRVNQRARNSSLIHIESRLFGSPLTPTLSPKGRGKNCTVPSEGKGENLGSSLPSPPLGGEGKGEGDPLFIFEATGIRGEAEMIAREIRRLVRTKRLNYSDIAVILRRIGSYEPILRTVFREFEIPVEIHERERLAEAPLARTLASFFKILLHDWKREDVFNFLKSSYVEKDYGIICSLEIRAAKQGILAGRERWLKEIGGELIEKIHGFGDRFEKAASVGEWIRLTEEVIGSFGLSQIPAVYEENARRDFASLARLRGLLEEIRTAGLSWEAARKNFSAFAEELLGLIEVDLFSLHDRDKNCVQVYDVSLARQKEYRVVFLAGLLEKVFPAEIREDPLLSDEERRGVGLSERLPRQALERYLFYLGLTRARDSVILSYPRFDLEGHEALPSFYVDEVKRLFKKDSVPERKYPVSQALPLLEDAVREREVEANLVKRLFDRAGSRSREERAFAVGLYNRFLEKPSFRELLPKLLFEPAAQIESEAVRAAFLPKKSVFSPTALENYSRCPYRFFLSHVLHLEEKEEGIDPAQVGTVLHQVLEDFMEQWISRGEKNLGEVKAAREFVSGRLEKLLADEPLSGDRAYRIELKKAQMREWLYRMVEKEIEEGPPVAPLRPKYFELKVGFSAEKDYLILYDPLKEDLKLRLKIDRIDVDPSGKYALVLDYKTGGEFKRSALDFGTALQLPLYLLAAQQHLKLKPLGGEIYKISEAESKGFYSEEALEELGAKPNSRAVFSEAEFKKILERAIRFSRKFAEGIGRAEIPVRPRDCDDHCPFPAVCRIEKWRLPFIYREIQEEDQKSGIAG